MVASPPNPAPNSAPLPPLAEPGSGLWRVLLLLGVLVACGISTVWEHVRAVRAGYRLHALETARERLREERRRLEVKRAREERVDVLERRAKELGIPMPGSPEALEALGG